MSKTVLLCFVLVFVGFVLGQKTCQSDSECLSGQCCGTGFRGEHTCTPIRAKGDVCWHYGTRDVMIDWIDID